MGDELPGPSSTVLGGVFLQLLPQFWRSGGGRGHLRLAKPFPVGVDPGSWGHRISETWVRLSEDRQALRYMGEQPCALLGQGGHRPKSTKPLKIVISSPVLGFGDQLSQGLQ